jgi:hypothetical protein
MVTTTLRPNETGERQVNAPDYRQQEESEHQLDSMLTDAYAEGRKDERDEWMPVLDALRQIEAESHPEDGRTFRRIHSLALRAILSVTIRSPQ